VHALRILDHREEYKVQQPGRIIILGAGPTGLGAAYRLRELGYNNFSLYEREERVGGCASSIRTETGFTWDFGVHVLFSQSAYFNRVMDTVLAGEWIEQRRDAQIWMHGRFVPYPLQYNIHHLPNELHRDCFLGLARAATYRADPPANFLAWIVKSFGHGIARHFMVPYNEKVWGVPLDSLDINWIAERVPRPDLKRVLANFLDARDDDGWGPNAWFRYPRTGGIGTVWRRVADRVGPERIVLRRPVTRVDPAQRRVYFADGDECYDVLISTIPLDRLVMIAAIDALRPAAAALKSSTVHIIGIGIEGTTPARLGDRRWIYFPDPSLPFYRVSVLSNFSPANAPNGHWSLLAEVRESKNRLIDRARLVAEVVAGMRREGIIPPASRVVSYWHDVVAPGYPIPTRDRDRALSVLLPALEGMRIFSRGRFGAWKYEISNQDHSFLQGVELAERLILGRAETTLAPIAKHGPAGTPMALAPEHN
jgi:protoporphyrinogen oxidase